MSYENSYMRQAILPQFMECFTDGYMAYFGNGYQEVIDAIMSFMDVGADGWRISGGANTIVSCMVDIGSCTNATVDKLYILYVAGVIEALNALPYVTRLVAYDAKQFAAVVTGLKPDPEPPALYAHISVADITADRIRDDVLAYVGSKPEAQGAALELLRRGDDRPITFHLNAYGPNSSGFMHEERLLLCIPVAGVEADRFSLKA